MAARKTSSKKTTKRSSFKYTRGQEIIADRIAEDAEITLRQMSMPYEPMITLELAAEIAEHVREVVIRDLGRRIGVTLAGLPAEEQRRALRRR